MRLVWKRLARADRKEIHAYVARHNPAAALALGKLLRKEAAWLTQYPYMGRIGRLAGTRESLKGLFVLWRLKPPVLLRSRTQVRSLRKILAFNHQRTKILLQGVLIRLCHL